jgi:hypothetical protein
MSLSLAKSAARSNSSTGPASPPTGTFNIGGPYIWDISQLYTTGQVTLLQAPHVPGDFNQDGEVDGADYVIWRTGMGTTYSQQDYTVWRTHFGYASAAGSGAAQSQSSIPEPTALTLALIAATFITNLATRRAR